jgi:hypothetical protein
MAVPRGSQCSKTKIRSAKHTKLPRNHLSSNHSPHHARDAVSSLLLNLAKSHQSTALTLHVLNQSTEQLIVSATACLGATVYLLVVERALQVVVQTVKAAELFGAEVTLVCIAIPSPIRSNCLHMTVTRQLDHWSGNDIVAVQLANCFVDLVAVEAGGASTRLQVNDHARGIRE